MATIGSLFSGIGGLELGLERATGAHTVWNCEMEEFCRKVLAKHWPDAAQYTDVREIDDTVERVDILCGGFPCQDLSVAGSRKGLAGERSGLWNEYARIIRLLRPRFVLVENVPALRTLVSDDGLGRVLGDLAESGYDTEWDCVPAAAVGAPHVRDRIFILAWRRELADADGEARGPEEGISEQGGRDGEDEGGPTQLGRRGGDPSRGDVGGDTTVGNPDDAGREERRGSGSVRAQQPSAQRASGDLPRGLERRHDFPPRPGAEEWDAWLEAHPTAQPGVRRDPDGVRGRVDQGRRRRLKALGNAVVPQAAAYAWHLLSERAGVTL
jgi:DNA (cytosine-5)-methyltransferase 1